MPAAPSSAVKPGEDLPAAGTEFDESMAALYEMGDARDRMIRLGLPFAARIARHYHGRGEPLEDLVQVATVGLIKAVDGYDPERGPFSHYAGPTVRGELKKHFRDRGWSVRVPRRLQELKIEISRAHQILTHRLGRAPTVTDLARHLHIDEELVIEGLDLAHAYQPVSLDAPISDEADASDLGELLGDPDPAVESADDRMTLATLLPHLPEREQRILYMRFSGNMTQTQIAAEVGISQMHVSRLLAQALAWLRDAMSGDAPPEWPGSATAHAVGPGALRLDVERLPGGKVLVVVAGEVDHDTAPALRTTLCGTAIADRPVQVRVDLGRAPFLDAAGVDALVAGYRAASFSGAEFALDRPRRTVVDVLLRAGLGPVFGLAGAQTQGRGQSRVAQTTLPD